MNTFPLLETEPLSPEANHRIFTALAREMTLDAPAVAVDGAELVEDATISYLQPDEPARRYRRRPWLVGLVAVAAGLLAAGIMVRDNAARTRTGNLTPETMPIYLPTWLPDGFAFVGANDYTVSQWPAVQGSGVPGSLKPIGARAVQITTSPTKVWEGHIPGHPIVLQGRQAFDASAAGLPAIWLTDGPVTIRIAGLGVTYAEIERIAGSARAVSPNPADGANVVLSTRGTQNCCRSKHRCRRLGTSGHLLDGR